MDLAYPWGRDWLEGTPLREETEAPRWVHQARSTNSRCQPRRPTRLSRQKLLQKKKQWQHRCYLQVHTDLWHPTCLSPHHPLLVYVHLHPCSRRTGTARHQRKNLKWHLHTAEAMVHFWTSTPKEPLQHQHLLTTPLRVILMHHPPAHLNPMI